MPRPMAKDRKRGAHLLISLSWTVEPVAGYTNTSVTHVQCDVSLKMRIKPKVSRNSRGSAVTVLRRGGQNYKRL